MEISDWTGIAAVTVGVVGILIGMVQSKKANKKELSFPVKNPHVNPCFIEPFDKNAQSLQEFIFKNKQRRVF